MLKTYRLIKFMFIMSKGPFVARINRVDRENECNVLKLVRLRDERKSEVKMPADVDISALKSGMVITYYLAEDDWADVNFQQIKHEDRPVVIFESCEHGEPVKEFFLWLEKGECVLKLEKLPKIAEILLNQSYFYSARRILVEKSLDILKLTQDPETIDALFSMPPLTLYKLLGETVHTLSQKEAAKMCPEVRWVYVRDAFVCIQIADSLLAMAHSGVDLESPRRRDLRRILGLALLHGENEEKINDFIASYKRE